MRRRRVPILLLCVAALCVAAVAAILMRRPPVRYQVTFLPSLGGDRADAYSINDRGQIVGIAQTPADTVYIFLWDKEHGFRDLGRFDDPPHPGGLCINNLGQIAGTTTDPNGNQRAFLRDPNSGEQLLGALGGRQSAAEALSNTGWLVGHAETPARLRHAFVWNASGGMRDLGTLGGPASAALSVNDAGQVVGFSETADRGTRIVLWDGPPDYPTTDLGDAGVGPFVCEINNNGLVVQRLGTITGKTYFQTWTRAQGSRTLGLVAIDTGIPCGLNDANQFLVRAPRPAGLNLFGRVFHRQQQCHFWNPNQGSLLLENYLSVKDIAYLSVRDLNIHGDIVGVLQTRDSDQKRAVLLEPVGKTR
jgi:probable HAF family extracellular repeat protein